MVGQRLGLWTVLRHEHGGHWVARCDCGTERVVRGSSLRQGRSKGCGHCGQSNKEPLRERAPADRSTLIRRQNVDTQAVIDAIHELPLIDLAPPRMPAVGVGKDNAEEIAVLHISDVQYGKVTESYSSDVARERLLQLAAHAMRIIDVRKRAAKITELRLYLGGDIIEGQTIFKGQAYRIDAPVYVQAIHGASASLAKVVLQLLQVVQRIQVFCVRGNHGRDDDGSPGNWDNVTYEMLKYRLLGGDDVPGGSTGRSEIARRLSFQDIGKTWYAVDRVYDWGNLIVHGDQFRGAFLGNGFRTRASGWIDSIPEAWDYLWFGHFHQHGAMVLNRRVLLANGTTESDNDYAQESFAATGDPTQRLAFFNRKYGIVADCPIYLGMRHPNRK